jgi:hypothetical protein
LQGKETDRAAPPGLYMSSETTISTEEFIPTRYTLLSRLQNWEDNESWKDFFDTYWRLIYSLARKSGLTEVEAQDAVQETVISVAKHIHKFRRDRKLGSFKGWLRNITRWRIADQLRKRTHLAPAPICQIPMSRRFWSLIPSCRNRTRISGGMRNGMPICYRLLLTG